MSLPKNKPFHYTAYLVVRLGTMILHMLPFPVVYAFARFVAALLWRFDAKHRRRAIEHLRRSFPDWPESRVVETARRSVRNMVYMGMEIMFTTRMIQPQRWRMHIALTNMAEPIRRMVTREGPMILVTGHFGNWEVAGYMTAAIGLPTYTIARHIDNPYLHDYIMGVRQRAGQVIIDKKGASAIAPQLLADRQVISIVGDQDGGKKGVFVDFFGRKASTFKSVGLLAMQYDAPVAVIYCRRLNERYQFEIGCERLIRPDEWAAQPDPLRYISAEYTAAIERVARSDPSQYFWVHRRWKHRPKGEPKPADGVA